MSYNPFDDIEDTLCRCGKPAQGNKTIYGKPCCRNCYLDFQDGSYRDFDDEEDE